MATTSLQVGRREFARRLGYGESVGKDGLAWSTTTGLTGAAAAVLIATGLRDAGFDDLGDAGSGDDVFQNWWVMILGTGNAQVVRRVKSYDASAAQITVAGTNLATETGNVDFELHKYSPSLLREVLNTASRLAFPTLYVPITRTLFTANGQVRYEVPSAIINRPTRIWLDRGVPSNFSNNIVANPGFETFSGGAFTSWAADTNLTVAQETMTTTPRNYAVFRDQSSARLTNGTTGTKRDFEQTVSSPGTYSGQRISLSIWVYCLDANSVVSTQITDDGGDIIGTTGGGGIHRGTGWELLTQTLDRATTLGTFKYGVSLASGAVTNLELYVDEAIVVVGPTQEPEPPGEELLNWEWVPQVMGTTLRNEVVFPAYFPDGYRLRFEGKAYLSSLSAETDTVEIGPPETDLWYAYATWELARRMRRMSASVDTDFFSEMEAQAQMEINRQLIGFALQGPKPKLLIPDWG